MKIQNPVGLAHIDPVVPARREGLNGKRVGMLVNGKEYSDAVLERLATLLKARGAIGEVRFWDKGWPVQPAPFIKEIAGAVEFVINGVGH